MQKPKVDPDLARGLNFTPEDLAANRQGYMSRGQWAKVQKQREAQARSLSRALITSIFGVVIFAAAVIFLFVAAIFYQNQRQASALAWLACLLAIPAVTLAAFARSYYNELKTQSLEF